MTVSNIFYNVDFDKDLNLPQNYYNKIKEIQGVIKELPALKIVNKKELLNETIVEVNNYFIGKSNFVVFGTGGSSLGAKALINIKKDSKKNIIFLDNIDPNSFAKTINNINLIETGFIIISKSGTTPETLSQFASLIEIFDQKKKLNVLFKNTLIITENKLSPLREIARINGCKIIDHEKNIGGRFSVFSTVGIVPSILAGLDVKKIYEGVLSILNEEDLSKFMKISKFFCFQEKNKDLSQNIIMTYSDSLYYFAKWYLQLWAESIGKNGKGFTPIHAVGTTDQHSQLQLYLDGPKDKFFIFITTNHNKEILKLHKKTMNDFGINYLFNKSMGDLMQAEQQATIDTFKKNNFSLREIFIEEIDEFSIGEIMAISIIEVISTCMFLNVNPFDQPAVEQGKNLTKEYLS